MALKIFTFFKRSMHLDETDEIYFVHEHNTEDHYYDNYDDYEEENIIQRN
ncbi:hypothetical protein KIS4809_2314 [Bacillus sp. ZZV12-4809]|nr:hypothetical protein KIS4809_2314 [Bacillus sp. ZZV12-4809]